MSTPSLLLGTSLSYTVLLVHRQCWYSFANVQRMFYMNLGGIEPGIIIRICLKTLGNSVVFKYQTAWLLMDILVSVNPMAFQNVCTSAQFFVSTPKSSLRVVVAEGTWGQQSPAVFLPCCSSAPGLPTGHWVTAEPETSSHHEETLLLKAMIRAQNKYPT